MGVEIYIGKNSEKEKRYIELKENEANHITFLGPSGSGKTTVMRALAEEIFEKVPGALVIVVEQKFDKNKVKDLNDFIKKVARVKGRDYVKEKYGEVLNYLIKVANDGIKYGKMGDFAFGWPNYPFSIIPASENDKHSILSYHGLHPKKFPVKRIVFRPVRDIDAIERDNNCEVVEGKIRYKDIDFSFIEKIAQINRNTIYGRIIRQAWDLEGLRDPKLLENFAEEWERKYRPNSNSPSTTYLSIMEVAELLKKDRLLNKDKDFTSELTTDKIIVIDFSANSELYGEEEAWIIKHLVDYIVTKFVRFKNTPVFMFFDEIQNILQYHYGRLAIEKLHREGRSNWVNIIAGTQYMYGLPAFLVYGAAHIGIVGRIASADDEALLSKVIKDFHRIKEPRAKTFDDYRKLKPQLKGRGWFSFDKMYTERMYFRPPQSL
ncbi:DEAD/DEAH box helicase family protein [Pyrococcus kukulkanii]|uniref:DEAD/DEAH box helicase family protein n=1 Tax=Pyrococcus kukulkanii TaxID=1609559 RepID=UPI003561369E